MFLLTRASVFFDHHFQIFHLGFCAAAVLPRNIGQDEWPEGTELPGLID